MTDKRYHKLSPETEEKIRADINAKEITAIRRNMERDKASLWRPAFVRDVDKIINCPYYNRYTDKTQVFSFYKNDDISRRALHVQLVSRIARNIGRLLGLNQELIEAIALGHDIGHTPFGHAGEAVLDRLYHMNTGRYFCHNLHSVRVLDGIFNYNISLQTLNGILCHNGELELEEYRPSVLSSFAEFDGLVSECYTDKNASERLVPSTLEGCVVRISDIIAYIGKDRQDAQRAGVVESDDIFADTALGRYNAVMINNLCINIIENSYGKDYIKLDTEYFEALKEAKSANYKFIYGASSVSRRVNTIITPMFERMYSRFLTDLKEDNRSSPVFKHHIEYVDKVNSYYNGNPYRETEPNQIVVDYIASMTDDYFTDMHDFLFPGKSKIEYIPYFIDLIE